MSITFTINGKAAKVEAEPDTPLLWMLREDCSSRARNSDAAAASAAAARCISTAKAGRSCQTSLSRVEGKSVTTIEGLRPPRTGSESLDRRARAAMRLLPVRPNHEAASLLAKNKNRRATRSAHMSTNLCRCGTYQRIVKAIQRAAREA